MEPFLNMPVNLSIKNVPDALAQALRDRAALHRRSLQQELMCLLEQSVDSASGQAATLQARGSSARQASSSDRPRKSLQEIADKARRLFPQGTEDSTPIIRQMRDAGLHGNP